jgi:hypothetical protein
MRAGFRRVAVVSPFRSPIVVAASPRYCPLFKVIFLRASVDLVSSDVHSESGLIDTLGRFVTLTVLVPK